MAFSGTGNIWMNGKLINWADATIHAASHVIHYGSGVFEGARCYKTPQGSACFRLDAHMRRLYDSARIYRMDYGVSQDQLTDAVLETIKANNFDACYIRPLIYRGYNTLGVNPLPCPVDAMIIVWEWDSYFDEKALEAGTDVKVSTWNRPAPNTFPAMAKSVANYANSGLIKMEAVADGYSEGVALDVTGQLSEGSGQNIFLVRNGALLTPPLASSALEGITRDTIITLAKDMGLSIKEQALPREMLYVADEIFFVGTAVEVVPIRSVDRITVGAGKRGPVTAAIQQTFFDYVNGKTPDRHNWLTFVNQTVAK